MSQKWKFLRLGEQFFEIWSDSSDFFLSILWDRDLSKKYIHHYDPNSVDIRKKWMKVVEIQG